MSYASGQRENKITRMQQHIIIVKNFHVEDREDQSDAKKDACNACNNLDKEGTSYDGVDPAVVAAEIGGMGMEAH